MQKNTKAAKEAHTELRNCKHEIKEIKKFSEFRAWWTKCQIKVVQNIPVYLLSSTYITGCTRKQQTICFNKPVVSSTKQREYLVNLIYFSDGFRLITHADNKYGNTMTSDKTPHKIIVEKNAGKLVCVIKWWLVKLGNNFTRVLSKSL